MMLLVGSVSGVRIEHENSSRSFSLASTRGTELHLFQGSSKGVHVNQWHWSSRLGGCSK